MFSFSFPTKKPKRNMNPRRPRLERRNAVKNIDYDAAAAAGASAAGASAAGPSSPTTPDSVRVTRSLDLSPSYSNQTSFRIGGSIEGEFDLICRSLGLSGPEDFAVPAAVWEANRARRSSSDLLPRSRLSPSTNQGPAGFQDSAAARVEVRVREDEPVRSTDGGIKASPETIATTQLASPTSAEFKNLTAMAGENEPVRKSRNGDGGIKGVRPPTLTPPEMMMPITTQSAPPTVSSSGQNHSPSSVLAPPPSVSLPEPEKVGPTWVGSNWDLVRSFAPDDKEGGRRRSFESEEEQVEEDEDEDEDEDEEEEEEELRVRLGGVTSEDVTSTSNDDDSSSTTTEVFVISPNGRFKRNIKAWQRGHLLGSGSFGTVYEGISDNGFFFAVKEVSLLGHGSDAQQCINQLEQEIALLSQFEHENIVQYYGTDKDKEETKLFIFIELVTQGSLASLYQKYHLRDSQVSAYTRQILKGLNYLHERKVVHRDIKCANILVDANGSVKLADFGLAKQITKLNVLKSSKGSVYWMAPEVLNPQKPYGPAADIWSLGCTVLEMLTGQVPYPGMEWPSVVYKVGKGEKPPIPSHLSKDARDFITQCVQANPADRPSASQLQEHPFVRRSLPFLGPGSDYSSSPGNNRWN